jgi:hypothetical protein
MIKKVTCSIRNAQKFQLINVKTPFGCLIILIEERKTILKVFQQINYNVSAPNFPFENNIKICHIEIFFLFI